MDYTVPRLRIALFHVCPQLHTVACLYVYGFTAPRFVYYGFGFCAFVVTVAGYCQLLDLVVARLVYLQLVGLPFTLVIHVYVLRYAYTFVYVD